MPQQQLYPKELSCRCPPRRRTTQKDDEGKDTELEAQRVELEKQLETAKQRGWKVLEEKRRKELANLGKVSEAPKAAASTATKAMQLLACDQH